MSATLRQTQRNYQATLDDLDRNDKVHQDQIDANARKRKDVQAAKSVIDEAVAKLPPEPKTATKPNKTAAGK